MNNQVDRFKNTSEDEASSVALSIPDNYQDKLCHVVLTGDRPRIFQFIKEVHMDVKTKMVYSIWKFVACVEGIHDTTALRPPSPTSDLCLPSDG